MNGNGSNLKKIPSKAASNTQEPAIRVRKGEFPILKPQMSVQLWRLILLSSERPLLKRASGVE